MSTVLPILIPKSKNILLLKDDVGKPKPNTQKLPDAQFCYGKAVLRDPYWMKQITLEGKEIVRKKRINPRTQRSDISFMVHGVKNKPSTPFDRIYKQYYASEAKDHLEMIYKQRVQTEPRKTSFTKNRSFSLRQQHNSKKESKKLFRLKQFQNIKSKVFQ